MPERELFEMRPEKIRTPEGERKDMVLIVDKTLGQIDYCGDPRGAKEWIEGQKSKEALRALPKTEIVEHIKGGLVMPGMIDTHQHPFLWASLEDVADASQIKKHQELIELAKKTAKEKKDKPVVVFNWRTELIPNLSRDDLDKVIPSDQAGIVFDPSGHGAIANSKMLEMITKSIGKEEKIAGDFDPKTGQITEGYTLKAFNFLSPEHEIIEGRVEKSLDRFFANGITGIHDLGLFSWNEFLAYLRLTNKYKEKEFSFPVTRAFLGPQVFETFVKNKKALEKAGLWKEELLPTLGLKLMADGSFGSRTAKLSEKYIDKDTRGTWAMKLEEMNRLIQMAKEQGIDQVAIHAIGDAGIKRAVELAKKWEKKATEIGEHFDPSKWRIEHFELPIPEQTLKEVKDLGLWVSMQPNFLTDYVYRDRLGERIKWICPHRKVLKYKIPMMFGTDGMPMETLFAIWSATHALEEDQRLNFEEALFGFSVMASRWTGKEQGWLKPGEKADIVVLDPSDLEKTLGTQQPKTVEEFDQLQKKVQSDLRSSLPVLRTFIEGKEVFKK